MLQIALIITNDVDFIKKLRHVLQMSSIIKIGDTFITITSFLLQITTILLQIASRVANYIIFVTNYVNH